MRRRGFMQPTNVCLGYVTGRSRQPSVAAGAGIAHVAAFALTFHDNRFVSMGPACAILTSPRT